MISHMFCTCTNSSGSKQAGGLGAMTYLCKYICADVHTGHGIQATRLATPEVEANIPVPMAHSYIQLAESSIQNTTCSTQDALRLAARGEVRGNEAGASGLRVVASRGQRVTQHLQAMVRGFVGLLIS